MSHDKKNHERKMQADIDSALRDLKMCQVSVMNEWTQAKKTLQQSDHLDQINDTLDMLSSEIIAFEKNSTDKRHEADTRFNYVDKILKTYFPLEGGALNEERFKRIVKDKKNNAYKAFPPYLSFKVVADGIQKDDFFCLAAITARNPEVFHYVVLSKLMPELEENQIKELLNNETTKAFLNGQQKKLQNASQTIGLAEDIDIDDSAYQLKQQEISQAIATEIKSTISKDLPLTSRERELLEKLTAGTTVSLKESQELCKILDNSGRSALEEFLPPYNGPSSLEKTFGLLDRVLVASNNPDLHKALVKQLHIPTDTKTINNKGSFMSQYIDSQNTVQVPMGPYNMMNDSWVIGGAPVQCINIKSPVWSMLSSGVVLSGDEASKTTSDALKRANRRFAEDSGTLAQSIAKEIQDALKTSKSKLDFDTLYKTIMLHYAPDLIDPKGPDGKINNKALEKQSNEIYRLYQEKSPNLFDKILLTVCELLGIEDGKIRFQDKKTQAAEHAASADKLSAGGVPTSSIVKSAKGIGQANAPEMKR